MTNTLSPLLVLFSLLVFLPTSQSLAATSSFSNLIVHAKKMVRDAETGRIDLDGEVQLIFEHQYLYCDKAVVDLNKKTFVAIGNVSYLTPTQSIDGDRMEMNYETGNGVVFNGFVQAGNVNFQGDIIRKVGKNKYEVENGEYTACKTCPPAWSFSGSKIKAELGGYAHITSPVFRLASYPFFWLPYLVVPLKSRRQSGFLFPTFSSAGEGGTAIGESYFWAIDDHRDLTFTLKNYSGRGLKGLLNYRFFADQESYGEFDGAALNDSLFPSSDRLTGRSGEEAIPRWFMKYRHYYQLPEDFIQRAVINLVSDIDYILDFQEQMGEKNGEPALENRVSLTKNTENVHFSTEAAFNINLLKTEAISDNADAVHRLPDIQLSWAGQQLGKSDFIAQFDASYTNFARDGFGYDDITFDSSSDTPKTFNPNRDGEFNFDGSTSADQIRAGQRLDLQPKLSYALNFGPYLDLLPSVSYRYTKYNFGFGPDPAIDRNYMRTEITARSRFHRAFYGDEEKDTAYKHEIIPEITYTDVPIFNQPNHPFFGTSAELGNFRRDQSVTDSDFYGDSGLQFDYFDRIVDRNIIRLGVSNTLTSKEWSEDGPIYKQVGLFRLSQSYDLIEARKGDDGQPWSSIEALLNLKFKYFETSSQLNYLPYHNVSDISSRAKIKDSSGRFLEAIYDLRYDIDDDDNAKRITENLRGRLGLNSRYINLYGQINYSTLTKEISSWEYQLALKPPGECWGLVFRHFQATGSDEVFYTFNFSYSFDGKKMVSVNQALEYL